VILVSGAAEIVVIVELLLDYLKEMKKEKEK
jgi:hypothetical protein